MVGYIRNSLYDTEDKTTLEFWVIHRENETETNEVEDDESKEDDAQISLIIWY